MFKKAIEINPNVAEYHYNLSAVHRRNEDVDDAIVELEATVRLAPDFAKAYYDLGHMYKLNHDNEKAVKAFRKYLELTRGKDPEADARVIDEIEALGGRP